MKRAEKITWVVEEKAHGRWTVRVQACTAAEALTAARDCGFTGPATVTPAESAQAEP